jgi:hypothetical protein
MSLAREIERMRENPEELVRQNVPAARLGAVEPAQIGIMIPLAHLRDHKRELRLDGMAYPASGPPLVYSNLRRPRCPHGFATQRNDLRRSQNERRNVGNMERYENAPHDAAIAYCGSTSSVAV